MRLGTREAKAFLARPDPKVAAVLVCGEDAARVAAARDGLLLAWLGPEAAAEMRIDRVAGADARRDPSLLLDALKARGFFPGPRAVLLEDAADGAAEAASSALAARAEGDARLLAVGAALPARSSLRRLFEGHGGAAAIVLYDDPPTEAEARRLLAEAGLGPVTPQAEADLVALAQGIEPGELRGLLDRLALHQAGATEPLGAATVAALAPGGGAEIDDLLRALSAGRRAEAAILLGRVLAQGASSVEVAIGLLRHARAVMTLASDPGGPQAGLARLRPPLGGARREAALRAAESWGRARSEEALREALALDLALRSGGAAPERALLERAVLRLARPAA